MGRTASCLQGLCLEVSRCFGEQNTSRGKAAAPRCGAGLASEGRQAFLLTSIFSAECLGCLPDLTALIKQLFLGDIVYVCWSQGGLYRHYFYLLKVNSG